MESIETKVKKWGNSFGIVIPKEVVDKENLREGAEITITIRTNKAMTVGELMELSKKLGLPKKLKRNTKEILNKTNKEFWGED
ncbi:AbrB/MazE/SpoVT family DNA-binding domain-containing protein [Candidatus Pacearchaeota archaeon]|nr:AbrB/MazE/SpoVT family DNA-binding domain-containing protein [Candidatus Pacearchaeota archaeon]